MGFFAALQFLTTLPSPFRRNASIDEAGRSTSYFPLVGMVLGLVLAGLDLALGTLFPPFLANALLLAGWVVLTGAMHLDGFMDTCDGVFARTSPERRLEIMRDSRVGSFGVAGGVLLLLVKYAALVSLAPPLRPGGLVLVSVAARLAMACCVAIFPYGRGNSGIGTAFQGTGKGLPLALNLLFVIALSYALFGPLGPGYVVALAVSVWLMVKYLTTKIPGLTGDTYGAIGEVSEVLLLLMIIADWSLASR